ncbi:MAG: hypothetical protein EPN85_02410 [Bacteroidetes bacterium]|nr:MAG: hypothetical protein EPN85_02410 [Bacteroidota bacterium]
MKAKQITALESYFKTENEHWNGFTFEMLCEVLQQGQFENPELPLQLFDNATNMFCDKHETPLQAIEQFAGELDKHKLTAIQKIFLYKWVCKYLNGTEYEKLDLTPTKDLLEGKYEKLKAENEPVKPLVKNIREMLKEIMQKEASLLPETLKGLDPVQRLNILCKLMPYVFPKVEAVDSEKGEPGN